MSLVFRRTCSIRGIQSCIRRDLPDAFLAPEQSKAGDCNCMRADTRYCNNLLHQSEYFLKIFWEKRNFWDRRRTLGIKSVQVIGQEVQGVQNAPRGRENARVRNSHPPRMRVWAIFVLPPNLLPVQSLSEKQNICIFLNIRHCSWNILCVSSIDHQALITARHRFVRRDPRYLTGYWSFRVPRPALTLRRHRFSLERTPCACYTKQFGIFFSRDQFCALRVQES